MAFLFPLKYIIETAIQMKNEYYATDIRNI
jgi:hypothetical protein